MNSTVRSIGPQISELASAQHSVLVMGFDNRAGETPKLLGKTGEKPHEKGRPLILVVEDSRSDVFLIREALGLAEVEAEIYVIDNGDSATKFVEATDSDGKSPIPNLVLLDLNLPKKRGDEVLRYLRGSLRCGEVQVVVVSTSDSIRDRAAVEPLGISAYFKKPTDYADFMKLGPLVKTLLASA